MCLRLKVFKVFASSLTFIVIMCQLIAFSFSVSEPYEWPEGDPLDYGFDTADLELAYELANQYSFLRSVLVIRHGMLLVEWYFNDGGKNNAFHIHSASKSFMSALIGIAFHEGLLESLDQRMLDFFPEYITPDLDPRKHNITIRHLLTMRAGFNFNDTADEWVAYAGSQNWVKYAIELPLLHDPGKSWHYSTPHSNLLSAILTKAANMSTREFAEQHLFKPLEISIRHWHQDPQGYYTGGHEMYFVPRDMARLGFLYLNNGTINGRPIIPPEWIRDSVQDQSGGIGVGGAIGYGYQWWLQEIGGFEYGAYETFSARGHGGQYILVIPRLDMVVVTTASGTIFDTDGSQGIKIRSFISKFIVSKVDPEISQDMPTDLNKDGIVNIIDISTVALAFGTELGDDDWNVIADLNNDEIVNILDIATVAIDFGKTT